MANANDEPKDALNRESELTEQRTYELMRHNRALHAERAKQLFEASAAMHRWVMASLLLLNTSAIATVLSLKSVTILENMESAIALWAAGACFAVTSGSIRSEADLVNGLDWQTISSHNFQQPFTNDPTSVRTIQWLRWLAAVMQFSSIGLFAWGLQVVGLG